MLDIHSDASLRSTLQYLMSSDMPSEHKAVLIDLVAAALRVVDASLQRDHAASFVNGPWQDEETSLLSAFLAGKTARSWQHADETLMQIATRLGRDPQYVRGKATDLGLGEGVDYRLAKVRASAHHED